MEDKREVPKKLLQKEPGTWMTHFSIDPTITQLANGAEWREENRKWGLLSRSNVSSVCSLIKHISTWFEWPLHVLFIIGWRQVWKYIHVCLCVCMCVCTWLHISSPKFEREKAPGNVIIYKTTHTLSHTNITHIYTRILTKRFRFVKLAFRRVSLVRAAAFGSCFVFPRAICSCTANKVGRVFGIGYSA